MRPPGGLARDSATFAFGTGSALAAAVLLNVASARWLGPGGKGELVLAFLVPVLLAPVAVGGIDTLVAAGSRVEGATRRDVLRMGMAAALVGGVATAAVTAGFGVATGLPLALVVLGVLMALVRPAVSLLTAVWTADGAVAAVGRVLVAAAVAQVAVVGALSLGLATPSDFGLGLFVATLVTALVLARRPAVAAARCGRPMGRRARRSALRFGLSAVGADTLQAANYRVDLLVLAAFVPVGEVGVYAVAVAVAEVLWQVPNAVSRSVLARSQAGEIDAGSVHRASRGLAAAGVVLGAGLLGATGALVTRVLGGGFADVVPLLALLLPGVVMLGAAKPLAAWMLGTAGPGRNLRASGAGFAVGVTADLLLIPVLGVHGAAIASTLSYAATAWLLARGFSRSPSLARAGARASPG